MNLPITVHVLVNSCSEFYLPYFSLAHKNLAADPGHLTIQVHYHEGNGSEGHAQGLKKVLTRLEPNQINVIADVDTVPLQRGWDDTVRTVLRRAECFGTSYDDVGGPTAGHGRKQTYKGLPNLCWMAMAPTDRHGARIAWEELDPTPNKVEHLRINDPVTAQTYGLAEDSLLLRDVGWTVPQFLKDGDLRSVALKNEKARVGCLSNTKYSEEFWLWQHVPDDNGAYAYEGAPFLAHQRGSNFRRFRKDPISQCFYQATDAWLERLGAKPVFR